LVCSRLFVRAESGEVVVVCMRATTSWGLAALEA
jgi:hypothetical protein